MDADTRTYLATLRALIDKAAQRGATKAEIISQTEKSKELAAFKRLAGYAELAPENIFQAVRDRDGLH
jgi:hypothetical protein